METNVTGTDPSSKEDLVNLYKFLLTQSITDVAWWLIKELLNQRRAIGFIRRKGLLSEYNSN